MRCYALILLRKALYVNYFFAFFLATREKGSIINLWKDVKALEFYKVLENLMKNKNLSIPDISRLTGLSDSTLRSIISRKTKNISLEVAFKISEGLNVTLEELNGDVKYIQKMNKNIELSKDEEQHIDDLRLLNNLGKEKVITYTRDLLDNPKYKKEENNKVVELPTKKKFIWEEPGKEHLMPIASHDREGEFTEEDYKHDEDLMKDDDFWK